MTGRSFSCPSISTPHFRLSVNFLSCNFNTGDKYHLEGASQGAAQNVGIAELAVSFWQFDKVDERIVFDEERELVAGRTPVAYYWRDAEEHLETDLQQYTQYTVHSTTATLRSPLYLASVTEHAGVDGMLSTYRKRVPG